jgi:hypothetical protein
VKEDDAVQMVGHDDKRIQRKIAFANPLGVQPLVFDNFSYLIQPHLPANHRAEQFFSLPGCNGDEIGACEGVTVAGQAGGAAVVLKKSISLANR